MTTDKTLTVFHLKNCDTCRKAIKALDAAKVNYDLIDVRGEKLTQEQITQIVEAVGWEAALNRRSTTWRSLDEPDRDGIDNVKAVALIAAHPTLLKRPAITDGQTVTVGWKDDAQSVWLT